MSAAGAKADGADASGVRAGECLEEALGLGYRALGRRDRTVSEVRSYLRRRDVDDATVEAALAELAEQGYLDDLRYARRFAEDRRLLDGWGTERIARRLDDAGVPPETIDAVLAERDPEEELDAAVALLRRRLGAPPADDRARERALGLLVRRGFELELAYDAVRAFERNAA